MKRPFAVAAALLLAVAVNAPHAYAASYPVAFKRAVAYWYLPTNAPDVHRLYRVEVVRVENLVTGEVSARASIVTDRCTERGAGDGEMFLACGDGRRERVTSHAELVVSPDLSAARATVRLGARTHVVRFEGYGSSQRGFFERDRTCSPTDRAAVTGQLANMERAHGRVLGKRVDRPRRPDLDHAWLESGVGAWCDDAG